MAQTISKVGRAGQGRAGQGRAGAGPAWAGIVCAVGIASLSSLHLAACTPARLVVGAGRPACLDC